MKNSSNRTRNAALALALAALGPLAALAATNCAQRAAAVSSRPPYQLSCASVQLQRIWATAPEKIEAAMQRYPDAFRDGFILSAFPEHLASGPEEVKDFARQKAFVQRFQSRGVPVQICVSSSIGHMDDWTRPRPGAKMVASDGRVAKAMPCPRDPRAVAEICALFTRHAALHPTVIWFDDDLRSTGHMPVDCLCFCTNCIAAFNVRTGLALDRPALRQHILADTSVKGVNVRDAWSAFATSALNDLVRTVGKAVHAVDDRIALGYMFCNPDFNLYGRADLSVLVAAGRNRDGAVWFRPGSGAYTDLAPLGKDGILAKNIAIARLCAETEGPGVVNAAEEVTYPYDRRTKSMAITFLECALNIGLAGCNGTTFDAIKPNLDEQLGPGAIVEMLNRRRGELDRMRALIANRRQIGVAVPPLRPKRGPVKSLFQLSADPEDKLREQLTAGIPFTFRPANGWCAYEKMKVEDLPVRAVSPGPVGLSLWEAADGSDCIGFLWNFSFDPQKPALVLKGSRWQLEGEIPTIPAWSVHTIRLVAKPDPLPGEPCTRAPLPPDPFPDRLSCYVWRNWGLVETERLARVVKATPEQLTAVAVEMGLAPNPTVLPEWKRKGLITLIRRNWHLLPYDQLMALLDLSREKLRFHLMEDDFLWVKLGCLKPNCAPLLYDPKAATASAAARRRLAQVLREEGLDPQAPEEPRFTFIGDILRPDSPAKAKETGSASPFDFRMIFSYFADYADPLGDPQIASYPEGLLQKLSDLGVNVIWLHTVLNTLAKDPKYPEFGAGSERRLANLRTLVRRAEKYGIRVFLYLNEPRAQTAEFFAKSPERAAFRGARERERWAMCTSDPEVRRWLADSVAQVFSAVPGLGGIFTITMSENLTNCASRWHRHECPRCRSRRVGDIVAEVNRTLIEGMLRGNPKAEALLYTWAWPAAEEAEIIRQLPKTHCRILCVSENAMKINRAGVAVTEADYAISVVGPGENALRVWSLAHQYGYSTAAKIQAANSWELSSFPYIPTMDLVAQHAVNLAKAGVEGVMLSWSLGCYPSPNLAVYRDIRPGETNVNAVLDRLAAKSYGPQNVARVRAAWTAFSKGFENYPFSISTVYNGPQQWGPANPLYAKKTGYAATMVGIPYDDLASWRAQYPAPAYISLMDRVAQGFAEGCRLLEGVAPARELAMFRAEQMHFESCRDQSRFVEARNAGDTKTMLAMARAELARAKAYWPLVRADSRIGYESSNHYFFIPRDVLEKILTCRAILR